MTGVRVCSAKSDGSRSSKRNNLAATSPKSGTTTSKRDVIADFTRGDKVDLSSIDANTTRSGNQKFTFVSSFSGRPGELQWDENSKGFMVSADVNGNGLADFSIQLNTKLSVLRASDFIL